MIELSNNISDYILKTFGEEYLKLFRQYIESESYSYLRFSGSETETAELIKLLGLYNIELEKHTDIPHAYKVTAGTEKIGKTLEYTIGKYYIQSLSSMIPPLVLNPTKTDITLDLCAAPGSKSTQLSEIMNNKGTLYANEPNPKRVKSLVYNLDRENILNMGVIQKLGEVLSKNFEEYFDKILVDAPCSGLGIVQKKGEISNWWNEKSVSRLFDTQLRLLISAIKMSRIGGEIVYSTCTLTVEENELILDTVLNKYPVELVDIKLPVKSHPAFTEYEGVKLHESIKKARRIIPWEVNSEGFFIAKLIKTDATVSPAKHEVKNRNIKLLQAKHKDIFRYILNVSEYYGIPVEEFERFQYIIKSNDINFIDADWQCDDPNLFLRIGSKFGTIDKRGNCHIHSLAVRAFQEVISKNIFEIENENDLEIYMNGGVIKKINDLRGQKVVKYKNHFVGTAVASSEGVKSQFPRAMRTHQIILE